MALRQVHVYAKPEPSHSKAMDTILLKSSLSPMETRAAPESQASAGHWQPADLPQRPLLEFNLHNLR